MHTPAVRKLVHECRQTLNVLPRFQSERKTLIQHLRFLVYPTCFRWELTTKDWANNTERAREKKRKWGGKWESQGRDLREAMHYLLVHSSLLHPLLHLLFLCSLLLFLFPLPLHLLLLLLDFLPILYFLLLDIFNSFSFIFYSLLLPCSSSTPSWSSPTLSSSLPPNPPFSLVLSPLSYSLSLLADPSNT